MFEPRFDVTTFGEMMLRLSVPSGERLETATRLDVYPAGAESNVVSLLARLEHRTLWSGILPNNPLGRLAGNALRLAGVDLNGVIWREGGRMGTYYVEFGAPPRGIQVVYDRAHSCATQLRPEAVAWEKLLDTRLLHLTGITPALSASCLETIKEALHRAKERQIPVSFDVNYRQKLWSETEAGEILAPLMRGVTLLFCNQVDALRLFGCQGTRQEVAQRMLECSQAQYAIITFAEQGAMLWDGNVWHHAPAVPTQVVDRLGAGDSLAAGVIHGWLEGDLEAGLRYGVTLAALALSQFGDMVVTNKAELFALSRRSSSLTR